MGGTSSGTAALRAPAARGLRAPRAAAVPECGALLPEHRRFCPECDGPVGRARAGRPGRMQGTCPWCRQRFDLRPHLRAGDLLAGRYTVAGPLARGARSWHHRAHDAADGAEVVLVRVRGQDGRAEAGALAVDEPDVLLALGHPGLVRVRDVVDGPGPVRHLVLDHVAGAPPVPGTPEAAAALVTAVLPALGHLHAAGLLHADLKPANVLGTVLVDLGSVRRAEDRTSPVWGTEAYLAPEVAPGGTGPSVASDIWAAGRVLAELGACADARLAAVVARATDPDPGARPPDTAALAALLRAAVPRLRRGGSAALRAAVHRGAATT